MNPVGAIAWMLAASAVLVGPVVPSEPGAPARQDDSLLVWDRERGFVAAPAGIVADPAVAWDTESDKIADVEADGELVYLLLDGDDHAELEARRLLTGEVAWTTSLPGGPLDDPDDGIGVIRVLDDDVVLVTYEEEGRVEHNAVIERATGDVRRVLDPQPRYGVRAWRGVLTYATMDRLVGTDAVTGEVLWSHPGDFVTGMFQGTVTGARRTSGSADEWEITAFDAVTGEVLWSGPTSGSSIDVIVDGLLVRYGEHAGPLGAVDAATGEQVWAGVVDDVVNVGPAGNSDVAGLTVGGRLVRVTRDGSVSEVATLDIGDLAGQRTDLWTIRSGKEAGSDRVVVQAPGRLATADLQDRDTVAVDSSGTPVIADAVIYTERGSRLLGLDPTSLDEQWSVDAGGEFRVLGAFPGGVAVLVGDDHVVVYTGEYDESPA